MSLLLPRPAARPSPPAQASTHAHAASRGPIKALTIHAASSGAHGAFDTTSPATSSPDTPSSGPAPSRGPGPARNNDNCGDTAAGPVRYGYTAEIAERFAAHPVPEGHRPGRVIRVDR